MVKIFICTTFRDFKGTDNDKIQYMFLDNLKNQSYDNFTLVTTTFGEKKVKQVVDSNLGEKSIVVNEDIPSEYRFSLTDVLLNAIKEAEKLKSGEKSIIVWCTCDVMFESTFFQTLVENYSEGMCGIVHPNIQYRTVDDLLSKNGRIETLKKGIDLLFFDSTLLINSKMDIEKYRFYDWGVFEYFLVALAKNTSNNRINLFCKTKLRKVVNDRKLTNESKAYFKRCLDMNYPVLLGYLLKYNIANDFHDIIEYNAHTLFRVIDKNWEYRYIKARYIFMIWSSKLHLGHVPSLLFSRKGMKVNY